MDHLDFVATPPGSPVPDLAGFTLIVPAVSVGNVGQLAADLIITTLRLPRVGFLDSPAVLPCVGADGFPQAPGLVLPLELFASTDLKLAVLQQRAPAAPGLQRALASGLAAWAAAARVAQVCVLGSLDATLRRDLQISGTQLRFWAPPAGTGSSPCLREACEAAGLAELEAAWFAERVAEGMRLPPWPLLCALREAGVAAAGLLCFSAEGDNRPDALAVCGAAERVLGLRGGGEPGGRWEAPPAWRWVYGARQPMY